MDQLKRLLASLSRRQKIKLVIAAVVVVGGMVGLLQWRDARDFVPLYSGLSTEDAASVVARLKQSAVEYRLQNNGSTILVRSARAAELRLEMASAGLPQSGRIGFELFDRNNFGVTEFAEQINYHRALEGELERSVASLAEVDEARVHITKSKDSVFAESRQAAKASVLVKLRPGARLAPANVQAVAYLVSSAVEGLAAEAVTILDVRGNLLSRPRRALADGAEPSEATLEYRQSIERDLLAKIRATLEPLLGPESFRAGVSVDCDFSSGEQSEETFAPDQSVMLQSQRTEDLSGAAQASGVPGTASNLARPSSRPLAAPGGGVARRTENISYATSRTVRRVKLPQGVVKRMSVALLIDHAVRFEGSGATRRRIVEPPPPARLQSIRELVAGAVGLQPDRGDQLVVGSLPFESTAGWEPPVPPAAAPAARPLLAIPAWLLDAIEKKNMVILGALGGAALVTLVILAVGIIWWRRRRKAKAKIAVQRAVEGGAEAGQLEQGQTLQERVEAQIAQQQAQRERQEKELLASLRLPPVTTKKGEVLAKHLAEESKKNPEGLAQIVRTWVNEPEERFR